MIVPLVFATVAQAVITVADTVPVLNVEPVCRGIATQGGESGLSSNVAVEKKRCIDSERATRGELVNKWPTFSLSDKVSCIKETKLGGQASYTELLTCLEMARDIRKIHSGSEVSPDQPTPTTDLR